MSEPHPYLSPAAALHGEGYYDDDPETPESRFPMQEFALQQWLSLGIDEATARRYVGLA